MIRLILIILGISLLATGIIYILNKLRGNKIFKFIPSLLFLVLSIYFIIKAKFFSEGMADLANFIIFIISASVSLITFIVTILIKKRKK